MNQTDEIYHYAYIKLSETRLMFAAMLYYDSLADTVLRRTAHQHRDEKEHPLTSSKTNDA